MRISTVSISRILKAASASSEATPQGRRKIRAPRSENQNRVAWIAPEVLRAEARAAAARAEADRATPAIQPQLVAQQAVQMLSQPQSRASSAVSEAAVVPMEVEVAAEQAEAAGAAQETGEV